jgi:AcrR family transcriptional regulator
MANSETDSTSDVARGRVPQQARAQKTRLLILEAAVKSLATRGFAATTTLQIQADAGVSRGRLLHHFPSRTELLLAAVEHVIHERFSELLTTTTKYSGRDGLRHVINVIWDVHGGDQFWAALELRMGAVNDPELAKALDVEGRAFGSSVRGVWDHLLSTEITSHARYEDLRETLITSMRGGALSYAYNRRDFAADPHIEIWVRTAERLLDLDANQGRSSAGNGDRNSARVASGQAPNRASR